MSADRPSTPNLCDAALAMGKSLRLLTSLRPIDPGWRIEGRARCVRHFGSVDIFLEAIDEAAAGEVLVIDNDGRDNEGCIGDLVTLEAARAGLAGMIVWGRHRDSADLRRIGLPVFSRGACSSGPIRLDRRTAEPFGAARVADLAVADGDWVVADEDGILFVSAADYPSIRAQALEIRSTEALQADLLEKGTNLREQLGLTEYRSARERDPSLTFRQHLRARGGAVEV